MKREIFLLNKTLDFKSINRIMNILENIPEIEVREILINNVTKKEGIKEYNNKQIKDISEARKYFEKIDKVDYISFNLKIKNKLDFFSLYYDNDAFFIRGWKIEADATSPYIDAFIYNIKKVFKFNIWDFYNTIRNLGLIIMWIFAIIISYMNNETIANIFLVTVILHIIDCVFRKHKAYKRSSFIKEHKDDIILGIVFYILGVITPYILQSFIK